MLKTILLVLGLLLTFGACQKDGGGDNGAASEYRVQMRLFVQGISSYARSLNAPFVVIPQNGHELITQNGKADGPLAGDYIQAISGIGREDLFYGYTHDNVPTPSDIKNSWLAFMDRAEEEGLEVLVIDYCSSQTYVDDSYQLSFSRGYISFAANHRELDAVPPYPQSPFRAHSESCASLSQTYNFLYLINPEAFASKEAFLDALQQTDYDLLVIDLFFNGVPLTASDIFALKTKKSGGSRLIVSYMSIGEAEDYRYYWKPEWKTNPPSWLENENSQWPGNYKVRYWQKEWQDIIFGNEHSYVKKIIDAGFDGVYLDLIDAFEYWENKK